MHEFCMHQLMICCIITKMRFTPQILIYWWGFRERLLRVELRSVRRWLGSMKWKRGNMHMRCDAMPVYVDRNFECSNTKLLIKWRKAAMSEFFRMVMRWQVVTHESSECHSYLLFLVSWSTMEAACLPLPLTGFCCLSLFIVNAMLCYASQPKP